MKKNKPKKPDQYRYVPIDKATRWQACQQIAKILYYTNLENVEVVAFLEELGEPPMVVSAVKKIIEKIKTNENKVVGL